MNIKAACEDCGLAYTDPGWIEAVIPDKAWATIKPENKGYGLLCITCISRRCVEHGLHDVPVWFHGTEPLRAQEGKRNEKG